MDEMRYNVKTTDSDGTYVMCRFEEVDDAREFALGYLDNGFQVWIETVDGQEVLV